MAKTKREFIIATFIVSCLATVISIVCFFTQEWVLGDLKSNQIVFNNAEINYGLFSGTFIQSNVVKKSSDITLACVFEENICAFSTKADGTERINEIKNILNNISCKSKNLFDTNVETTTISSDTPTICDKTFINSGLWLTTVIFLTFSIVMGTVTTIISVVNTTGNPISPWFNIWGLYIYNIISIISLLITLILWGCTYAAIISYNVGVIETINGVYSNLNISLGFSYWLILAPFVLHIVNLNLLYYRQHLINKEPEINEDKIDAQDKDGMIFVY